MLAHHWHKSISSPEIKLFTIEEMQRERSLIKSIGLRCVLALGCFDMLHRGHVDFLQFARLQGDCLIVGVNSDATIRQTKGETRPIVPEYDRAFLLASLRFVDYVLINREPHPVSIVKILKPDIFVKGYDWRSCRHSQEIISQNAGMSVIAPQLRNNSTTKFIEQIQNLG